MEKPLSLNKNLAFFWLTLSLILSCSPVGIYHTVEPGQTLYRIARSYNIEEKRLAQINHINDPTKLKVGQRLFIPGAAQTRKVPSTSTTAPILSKKPPKPPEPDRKSLPAAVKQKPKQLNDPPVEKPGTDLEKGFFSWPVKGQVLTQFGSGSGSSNKGIEIDVASGTSVRAAAPGKVIYSGNAIRGYGNLIILEHKGNYFTVYGYNKKNLVAMDDFVGKGDQIALSGTPPNGKSPRLHFEIRNGKNAVDPIFYLP